MTQHRQQACEKPANGKNCPIHINNFMGEDIPGTFKGDMTERVMDQMNYSAGPDTTTIHFCTLLLFE
ncbi:MULTISPECIES: hypothetical protein [unclassified Bifidobacterium]|uniref:hypothetical protein n=1 Tax=unclassified Bifidobacterium TaxID=2608897 RepID=UPI002269B241|nr:MULTISPECIES: hypothetical protein [unclassified Bifidobacterium]